jgi:hypothetical protein
MLRVAKFAALCGAACGAAAAYYNGYNWFSAGKPRMATMQVPLLGAVKPCCARHSGAQPEYANALLRPLKLNTLNVINTTVPDCVHNAVCTELGKIFGTSVQLEFNHKKNPVGYLNLSGWILRELGFSAPLLYDDADNELEKKLQPKTCLVIYDLGDGATLLRPKHLLLKSVLKICEKKEITIVIICRNR